MKRGFLNSKKAKKNPLYTNASSNQDNKAVAVAEAAIPATVAPADPETSNMLPGLPDTKNIVVKPFHGKVENYGSTFLPRVGFVNRDHSKILTEIPDGYDHESLVMKETSNGFANNERIIATVPEHKMDGPRDPDGYVQWLTLEPTRLKVINVPGFPKPIPKPVQLSHIVKDAPDMGKGVFATRDIKLGELIFAERPFVIVPRNINYAGVATPAHLTMAQQQRLVLLEAEKMLEALVGRMNEDERKEYNDLHNSHKEDGSGPLAGIVRSNGYGIEELADGPLDTIQSTGYSGVARDGSRINHSCMPNIRLSFSLLSLSFQFTATKEIKAGEQICSTYCLAGLSLAERREALAPYGFVCHCPACENATPETDLLRKEWVERIMHYVMLTNKWILDPNLSESVLDPVFALRDALIKEGLHVNPNYSGIYIPPHKVYMKLKQYAKAESYIREMRSFIAMHKKSY